MRTFILVLTAALLTAGCGSGDNRVAFNLRGRALAALDDTAGMAQVQVSCPGAGVQTVTGADGTFLLSGSVPATADGSNPHVGVWFAKEGFATLPRTFEAVDGSTYTMVAVIDKPSHTEAATLPVGNAQKSVPAKTQSNAMFTLFSDSLVDAAGVAVTGSVDVTTVSWDPTGVDHPTTAPYLGTTQALDGTHPYLRTLSIAQFSAARDGQPVLVGGSQGVGLQMTIGLPLTPELDETDNRLFFADPATGVLVEKKAIEANPAARSLQAVLKSSGTWFWARDPGPTSCVTVQVVGPDGTPAVGAHVTLFERAAGGDDLSLLDDRVGAPGGAYCLRSPVGKLGRVRVWLASPARILSDATAVSLTATGTCETSCQASVTVTLACTAATDCPDADTCVDGACLPPK